jgi:RHH-type rel operon transcriptional repressor/antitoxin RelB
MLEVHLDPELERTLAAIAARTGDAPGDLARAALLKHLEDLEDYAVTVEGWRANDPSQNISSEEMLRELGLDG